MTTPDPLAKVIWKDDLKREADVYVGGKLLGTWMEFRGLVEDPDDICDTINRAVGPMVEKAAMADLLANSKRCPYCPDQGFTLRQEGGCDSDGENDTRTCIQEQCEWCYTTADSFFNALTAYAALSTAGREKNGHP